MRGAVTAGLITAALAAGTVSAQGPSGSWTQWGGPHRNFIVSNAPRLADRWPESGPPVLWTRALGTGHSAIVGEGGRLYTMYRPGIGRGSAGPWEEAELVAALDAATGKTIWEHKYPSRRQDFGRGAGPHSTPLLVGGRLFTVGTNLEMFAFDTASGKVLWSYDLVKEMGAPELLIRPVVKSGYASSPIAYGNTVITYVGGPGQSVVAFNQADGKVVWKSGHFLTSGGSPILITLDGEEQLVCFAGESLVGMDPRTGRVLWAHPHDAGNDFNFSLPLWNPQDRVLFATSGYRAGSRAIRLTRTGGVTEVEELWFNARSRFQFLNGIRVGDFIYGTTGDMGPAFLSAINVKTGERTWQHRGFSHSSLIHADNKTILIDEDGDLALVRLQGEPLASGSGVTVLGQVKIFDTVAWTAPTLIGSTLYARDREKIMAFDLAPR